MTVDTLLLLIRRKEYLTMRFQLKHVLLAIIGLLVIVIGINWWHQAHHFNRNVTVNGINVGGLTTKQAFQKVKAAKNTNRVYLNGDLIYDGPDSGSSLTATDEAKMKNVFHQQFSFFPSRKAYSLQIKPTKQDLSQYDAKKAIVQTTLQRMNKDRQAPVDAYAELRNGKVTVHKGQRGTRIDEQHVLKQLSSQASNSKISLSAKQQQPLSTNSKTVQNEKKQLQKLIGKKVNYQVEKQTYHLTTADVITSATYKDGQYHYDTSAVDKKIKQINQKQATLGKAFKFKTPEGKEITTTKDGSYGWKISAERAGKTLADAIAAGKSSVNAKADIYGIGYNRRGTGYGVTENDGIGNTYAVISIASQHAWFYKDGKCVDEVDVVTGKMSNKADQTPKGVWYIMYKQSPSVLRGTSDNGSKYSSKVQYWAQFTDSGCGFHDASWRHNWSKTAYLNDGSNGCANMHPSDAAGAYNSLEVNEPVIVY